MSSVDYLSVSSNHISQRARQIRSWNPVSYRTDKSSVLRKRFSLVKLGILLIAVAASVILMMSFLSPTQATESMHSMKQYKSIIIHSGDSLWNIAGEYMDGHYSTRQEYIDELMFINNLDSDMIYANEYLLVPYYVG